MAIMKIAKVKIMVDSKNNSVCFWFGAIGSKKKERKKEREEKLILKDRTHIARLKQGRGGLPCVTATKILAVLLCRHILVRKTFLLLLCFSNNLTNYWHLLTEPLACFVFYPSS